MQAPVKPIHVFRDVAEFALRHKAGTEAEFEATQKIADAINKEDNKFKAWVLSKTRETPKRLEYLIVVQPGADGDRKIPQQGEPAKLRVVFDDNSVTRFWETRRIEAPLGLLSGAARCREKFAAFEVTVPPADAHSGIRPLLDASNTSSMCDNPEGSTKDAESSDGHEGAAAGAHSDGSDSGIGGCDTEGIKMNATTTANGIVLSDDNAVRVNFLLTASEATKNAELGALDLLCGRYPNASERQIKAFEYFVLLRNPEFVVDLHEEIPHLKSAMAEPSWPNSPLAKKFAQLNPQQQAAYLHGFRKLHCGICILPGGPGAGKTHFNLFTIAMAQSKPLPRPVMDRGRPEKRSAKVLFIVDMNSPVDDVANRMVRLYKELGMKKSVVRMRGWGAEVRTSDRLNAAEDAASEMNVDFTNQFLRTANMMSLGRDSTRSCQAPSLDEAAWQRYDQYKESQYEELAEYLNGELWEDSSIVPLRFRRLVYNLYRDTLRETDFVATTPVAASNHFRGLFKPDLVR
jgi:regulator of nonsense transcripts 1